MFEARYNGKNIRPEDYNEEIHKGNLCCPDPQCSATVHFVNESAGVDGSQTSRSAHYATNRNEKHVNGCEVQQYEAACHHAITSIKDGGFVLFNLNLIPKNATTKYSDEFRKSALVRGLLEAKADWAETNKRAFKTISIRNVGDLVRVIDLIEKKHGQDGLDRCFHNSGGFIMHHSRVDLRNKPEDVKQLYKDLITSSRLGNKGHRLSKSEFKNQTWFFGFPRIITVSGLTPLRGNNVVGQKETIQTEVNEKAFQQIIKPKSLDNSITRHELLTGVDCTLVARPHLCLETEKDALNDPKGVASLSWSLNRSSQFYTTETPPPANIPNVEIEVSGQMGWKWQVPKAG